MYSIWHTFRPRKTLLRVKGCVRKIYLRDVAAEHGDKFDVLTFGNMPKIGRVEL